MKYNTYLFDFDGTLVDSMPTFASVMLRILDENKIGYGDDIIKIITPLGCVGTARYFIERLGLPMSQMQVLELMYRYMYDEYANRIPSKPQVIDTLNRLKEMGASLHILTASPHVTLDVCLKRLGIYDVFENVWSCDDFNMTKADVEIYRRAAEKIGVTIAEILFLDDNYNAVSTAANAGMSTCGVFDETSREYIKEIKATANHYIYDFSEILTL